MSTTDQKSKKPVNKIDKEVFDTFFHESYCPLEYKQVKNDFEQTAAAGSDLFTEDCDLTGLTRENFILYLTNDAYCEFESIVEEAFETLNPEIVDAVMDLSLTIPNADEITQQYWSTCEELLHRFLLRLYDEKLSGRISSVTSD